MKKQNTEFSLVFIGKKDDIYTTSEIIAEHAGVKRHAVQVLIQNHESDFAEFGRVSFEMRPLPTSGNHSLKFAACSP